MQARTAIRRYFADVRHFARAHRAALNGAWRVEVRDDGLPRPLRIDVYVVSPDGSALPFESCYERREALGMAAAARLLLRAALDSLKGA